MEGKQTSVVLGGAAILAFLLSPLGPRTTTAGSQTPSIRSSGDSAAS